MRLIMEVSKLHTASGRRDDFLVITLERVKGAMNNLRLVYENRYPSKAQSNIFRGKTREKPMLLIQQESKLIIVATG